MTTEERLEKLERKITITNRRWVLINASMIALIWILLLIILKTPTTAKTQEAEAVQKEIRANRFVLVDKDDKERGELLVDGEFSALRFLDEKGASKAVLSVGRFGPGLILSDSNDVVRVSLSLLKDKPALALLDEKQNIRASLSVEGYEPVLELLNEDSVPSFRVLVSKNGPALVMFDENNKARISMNMLSQIGPMLVIHDENEKLRATLGTNKLTRTDGKTITYPESTLLLFGPDERLVWEAPR